MRKGENKYNNEKNVDQLPMKEEKCRKPNHNGVGKLSNGVAQSSREGESIQNMQNIQCPRKRKQATSDYKRIKTQNRNKVEVNLRAEEEMKVPPKVGEFDVIKFEKECSDYDNQLAADNLNPDEQNYLFYFEYCKILQNNYALNQEIEKLKYEKREVGQRLGNLEENRKKHEHILEWNFDIGEVKRKRFRRTAGEIARVFECPFECGKSYGSEGSLHQHLKLKHPEYYPTYISNKKKTKKNSTTTESSALNEQSDLEEESGNG